MFALISPVCTNPIGQYYLLYHSFGKKSMYKSHKILQRFLCRIPIDSKQGAPGPPARLCATIHVYPYPGTPTPYALVPHAYYLHTYIHALIHLFYLFILLSLSLFILLSLSLLLFSSLLFCLLSLSPCPLARPALGQGQQALSLLCAPMFYFI